jgi:DNA-binding CsgD family transcriptional regulator
MFSTQQDGEIKSLYLAGCTTYEIAERFGSSAPPVTAALRRQGVQLRPSGKKRTAWTGTPDQRASVVAAYEGGESIRAIARRLKIRAQVIIACLDDAGIVRRHKGAKPMLGDSEARQIAEAYLSGESAASIGQRFRITPETVRNYLKKEGVPIRPARFWTEERKAEAVRRYEAGESQQEIANALGCHQTAVSYTLSRLGVVPRKPMPTWERHASWKGGRTIDGSGYVRVKLEPGDRDLAEALPGGYVLEHRLVMARALGRKLRDDETVHHVNGDKTDNRLENLQLRTGKHGKGIRLACLDCGSGNVSPVPLS